jgi:hypothetical protein
MLDPMTGDERALLEHRWAVRVSLPGHASHAAQVARRLVDAAADAPWTHPLSSCGLLRRWRVRARRPRAVMAERPSWSAAAWTRPPSSGTWNAAPAVHHPTRSATAKSDQPGPRLVLL